MLHLSSRQVKGGPASGPIPEKIQQNMGNFWHSLKQSNPVTSLLIFGSMACKNSVGSISSSTSHQEHEDPIALLCPFRAKNAVPVPPSWDCNFWRQAKRAGARRPNSGSGYWDAPGAQGQECDVYCEILVFDIDVTKFDASCSTSINP